MRRQASRRLPPRALLPRGKAQRRLEAPAPQDSYQQGVSPSPSSLTGAASPGQTSPQDATIKAALTAAQNRSQALQKLLPPDQKMMKVDLASKDIPETWTKAAMKLVGKGDSSKVASFLHGSVGRMNRLIDVARVGSGYAKPSDSTEALAGPAIQALQAGYPNASIELVAVTDGTVKNGPEQNVIIRMSLPGPNNSQKSYAFALHPEALTDPKEQKRIEKAIVANPTLAQDFAAAYNAIPGAHASTAQAAFASVKSDADRTRVAEAMMRMPVPDQVSLYQALGCSAKHLLGGMLQLIPFQDDSGIVRMDATNIAMGQPSRQVNSQINILKRPRLQQDV